MMSRRHVLAGFSLAVLLYIASSAHAQAVIPPTDTSLGGSNAISGTVLSSDGGRIQRRIGIRLRSMTKGDTISMTDEYGNFVFRGLPAGEYALVIDKEKDFQPLTVNVTVIQPRGFPPQNNFQSIRLTRIGSTDSKPGVVNSELAGIPDKALEAYRKGSELATKGDRSGAIDQYKVAVAEFPRFTLAYNDLGVQYLKLNDLGRADDAFRTALNIDSKSFAPLQNHGIVLFTIKRYADAEKIFREVVKAKEGSAVGHYFLGLSLAYLDKSNWAEAEKELDTAIRLGGEAMAVQMRDAYYILGLIYGDKGQKKRQIAAWEMYLKLSPDAANVEQVRAALLKIKNS